MKSSFKIALIGNPNCGKTSIFNGITGLNQKVANYPGITVSKKTGKLSRNEAVEVIDIPGLYDLYPNSYDEAVVVEELLHQKDDLSGVVFVADATQLDKSLLLFSQVVDLGFPVLFVINMIDKAEHNDVKIDIDLLKSLTGAKIFTTNAKSKESIAELTKQITEINFTHPHSYLRSYYDKLAAPEDHGNGYNNWIKEVYDAYKTNFANSEGHSEFHSSSMIIDLKNRRRFLNSITEQVMQKPVNLNLNERTKWLDKVILHPVLGSLIFIFILFLIFQSIYAWSEWPMDILDSTFAFLSEQAQNVFGVGILGRLISEGIVPGLGGVLIFIPQIALLFIFIAFLEGTGYMSRVVFLTDRIMQKFGLNGRSVVPLISGVACSIPGIMAARTIDNAKERLITILVTPFMTCSARLPVYVIFIAIAIPDKEIFGFMNLKGITLFGLYALGTLAALFGSLALSKIFKSEGSQSMLMEIPDYTFPKIREILIMTYEKVRTFVVEAGKVIFFISIILWFLASFGPGNYQEKIDNFRTSKVSEGIADESAFDDEINAYKLEESFAGKIGKVLEPVVRPLGYDWKISIALLSSFAAREVFVGTLATIYSVNADFSEQTLIEKLKAEKNPYTLKPQFNVATSMSLLIFYVFAMQCMSTLAIVKRETGTWKWPILQFIVMTLIAYVAAFGTYQFFS